MNRVLRVEDAPRESPWPFDPMLVGSAAAIVLLGLVMVTSASISIAESDFGDPFHYFWRQCAALLVGLASGFGLAMFNPRHLERYASFALLGSIAALSLVLVRPFGLEANGAMRWLDLGIVTFQPGEAMKVVFVVYVAAYLARCGAKIQTDGRYALFPVATFCLVAALLLGEPDYGTVVVLGLTLLGMLFIAGLPLRVFTSGAVLFLAALAALAIASPYRFRRLVTFLDPFKDPYADGFQLVQALIAVGRGEWLGAGIGGSIQKLFYLPAAHTDFLYAVIGEELGFVGMAGVLALFVILIFRIFSIAGRANERGQRFNSFLAYGVGVSLGAQALINIGVNLGALPTKGLALPFMSYGGNNLVASCAALGLVLGVDRDSRGAPGR